MKNRNFVCNENIFPVLIEFGRSCEMFSNKNILWEEQRFAVGKTKSMFIDLVNRKLVRVNIVFTKKLRGNRTKIQIFSSKSRKKKSLQGMNHFKPIISIKNKFSQIQKNMKKR